jgi:hypothetical protein
MWAPHVAPVADRLPERRSRMGKFAVDSPLEGEGFEPSVPRQGAPQFPARPAHFSQVMVEGSREGRRGGEATAPPNWVTSQLTKLVDQPPDGPAWLHETKFDGYRMHARLDRGAVRLLTRTGLDWTHKGAPLRRGFPFRFSRLQTPRARETGSRGFICRRIRARSSNAPGPNKDNRRNDYGRLSFPRSDLVRPLHPCRCELHSSAADKGHISDAVSASWTGYGTGVVFSPGGSNER